MACADKAGYGAVRFGARRVAIYDMGFGAMLTRLGNNVGTIEAYFVTIARHSHEVASGEGRCHHTESAACNRLWNPDARTHKTRHEARRKTGHTCGGNASARSVALALERP